MSQLQVKPLSFPPHNLSLGSGAVPQQTISFPILATQTSFQAQPLLTGPCRNHGPDAHEAPGAGFVHGAQTHGSVAQPAQRSTSAASAFRWADRIDRNQQLIAALQARLKQNEHCADVYSVAPFSARLFDVSSAIADFSSASEEPADHRLPQHSDSNSTTRTVQSATASSPTSTSDTNSKASRASHSTQKAKKAAKKSKDKEGKQDLVNFYPRKKKTEEHRSKEYMAISLEQLKPLFKYPLKQAAAKLGICTTAFKSVCRKFGLRCWPYKLLKQAGSNNECIAMMLRDGAEEDGQ